MDDDKLWASVGIVLIVASAIVGTVAVGYNYKIKKQAFIHGYEQATLPGSQCAKWVKVKSVNP